MFEDEKKPERHMYISHGAGDDKLAIELIDALKSDPDVEITGRTFYKREYVLGPEDVAKFNESSRYYLEELDKHKFNELIPRLFISYAREDYHYVRLLAQSFNKIGVLGIKTWIDVEDIDHNETWIDEVLKALSSCSTILVLCSRFTHESIAQHSEIEFIIERMNRRSNIFLAFGLLDQGIRIRVPNLHAPIMKIYRMSSEEFALRLANEIFIFYVENIVNPKRLGEKLRQIRMALGISQNEMVYQLSFIGNISRQKLSAFERGMRVPPSDILLGYAQIARVGFDDLIYDELELPDNIPNGLKHKGVRKAVKIGRKQ